jgi:hypothetical protein
MHHSNEPHLSISIYRRVPSEAHDPTIVRFLMRLRRMFPTVTLVSVGGNPKGTFHLRPLFFTFAGMDYFLLAMISASTAVLCPGMSSSTLGQTLTTLPLGEMRKVFRLANFISL